MPVKKIFVLDKGFVYVGKGIRTDDPLLGESIYISECQNIRRYGTTQGLSELCYNGPTKNTLLDPSLPVTVPLSKIILTLEIDPSVEKKFNNED